MSTEDYIDVDFTKCPEYVPGYVGKQAELSQRLCRYEDAANVYSDADLKQLAAEIDQRNVGLEWLIVAIKDQRQEGSCVGNGTTQAFEICQGMKFGRDRIVQISAMSLYKRIGRSAQSGAIVSDAWDELEAKGVLPLDTDENKQRFKHTHQATGFSKALPSGWEETAKLFRGLEASVCDTMPELLSALVNGHPVVVGREGHCIVYVRPMWKDGRWQMLYANSWGGWGIAAGQMKAGFGIDTETQIKKSSDWAFAIRSITVPDFQTERT